MNQLRSVLVASLAASAAAYAPSALAGMPATSGTARPAAAAAAAAQPSPSRAVRAGGPVCQMRRGRQMRKPPAPKDNTPINEAIAFDEMRVLVRPQRRSPFSLHRHVSTTCVCLGGRPRRVGRDARRHAQGRRARRSGGALRCGAARDGAFAV